MAIDPSSLPSSMARSLGTENQEPEEEREFFSVTDTLAAPFRGIEAGVKGLYDFADFVTGDNLPDYNTRFLGKSETTTGAFVEGISQFATGFIPVAGQLGKIGRIANARKFLGAGVADKLAAGGRLTFKESRKLAKSNKLRTLGEGVAAGAASDFLMFDAQEERLSNLLYQYPDLQNPVTEYLKASEDDGEIEGRFKNVLEGLFLELGVGAAVAPFAAGVKMLKKRNKKIAEGKSKEDAIEETIAEMPEGATDYDPSKINDPLTGVRGQDKPPEEPAAPKDPEVKAPEEIKENELTDVVREGLKGTEGQSGLEGLRSSIRLISSEKDMTTIARALNMEHEDFLLNEKMVGKDIARTNRGELLDENVERSLGDIMDEAEDAFGADASQVKKQIQDIKDKGDNVQVRLKEVLKEQQAIRFLNNTVAENIFNTAKRSREQLDKARETGSEAAQAAYDRAYAEMLQQMELLVGVQRLFGLYGRFGSLVMLQRKFMFGEIESKGLSNSAKQLEEQSLEAISKYREEARGGMNQEKLLDLVLTARSADDIMNGPLNKVVRGSGGKRMFGMAREYWLNSLLSGVTTQEVNLIGSALTYALKTVERSVGALASGDFTRAKETIRYGLNISAITEAFSLAGRALKTGEAISIPDSRAFDDSSVQRNAISSERDDAFGTAINTLGTIIRLPSRGLIGGDELFKALSYRTYLMTELSIQGGEKGLRDQALAKYVKKGLKAHLTETGRVFNEKNLMMTAKELADKDGLRFGERDAFITKYMRKNKRAPKGFENRGALAAAAEQNAKVTTHTQDSENSIVRGISKMTVQNPWLTAVIPFVRTPANLLTFGIERSPFGLPLEAVKRLSSSYREGLKKGTAVERAELKGKLATSAATTAGLAFLFQSQEAKDFISGYGPRDENKRKAWLKDNQPYSIRIGDRLHSYQRLDPAATALGIIADISEGFDYGEYDEKEVGSLMGVFALAFSNNITNKSYVQGIDNLFKVLKDPVRNTERFVGSIAGGMVPNFLNQTMNTQEDRPLREVRGILDYAIKRIPGAEGKLPPRRDFLGEIETMNNSGGAKGFFDPIYSKDVADNIVDYEIGNLGAGFGKPSHFLRPGVKDLDTRDFYNKETGQQAYDRWMELVGTTKLQGRTLRQTLEKLFNNKRYQSISDEVTKADSGADSPKVKAIRRVISAYNSRAKYQMLNENPELKEKLKEAYRKLRQQQGAR